MRAEDFKWFVMESGDYEGVPVVWLQSNHDGQKGNELSLQNTNTKNDEDFEYPAFPKTDDPFALYNLLYKQIFVYMPPNTLDTRIFHRIVTKKQLKVCTMCVFN